MLLRLRKQRTFKRTSLDCGFAFMPTAVHTVTWAVAYVPADIYVRYLRLKKQDVCLHRRYV